MSFRIKYESDGTYLTFYNKVRRWFGLTYETRVDFRLNTEDFYRALADAERQKKERGL